MISSSVYTYSIEDSCKHCGNKIVISDIKNNDRIVGRIVECSHCRELHRVDSNLSLESMDCFLDRQKEWCMASNY